MSIFKKKVTKHGKPESIGVEIATPMLSGLLRLPKRLLDSFVLSEKLGQEIGKLSEYGRFVSIVGMIEYFGGMLEDKSYEIHIHNRGPFKRSFMRPVC